MRLQDNSNTLLGAWQGLAHTRPTKHRGQHVQGANQESLLATHPHALMPPHSDQIHSVRIKHASPQQVPSDVFFAVGALDVTKNLRPSVRACLRNTVDRAWLVAKVNTRGQRATLDLDQHTDGVRRVRVLALAQPSSRVLTSSVAAKAAAYNSL